MSSHTPLPAARRHRIATAAIATVGAIAPIGVTVAAAAPAQAQTSAPVNGPITYWVAATATTPSAVYTQNVNGTGQTAVDVSKSCTGPSGVSSTTIPAGVSYSPDGTKAVVDCDGDFIAVTQANLQRSTFIYREPGSAQVVDQHPVWSPDGTTIYYTRMDISKQPYTLAAYQVRVDGTNAGPVAGVPADYTITSVAANGALLLTSPFGQNGMVTVAILDPGSATPRTVASGQGLLNPTISPDGTKIALTRSSTTTGNGSDLWSYNADGTNPKQLTASTNLGGGAQGYPVWSPDSKQIAYQWVTPANHAVTPPTAAFSELHIVPADGSTGPTHYTSTPGALTVMGWHNGPVPNPARPTVARLAGGDRVATSVAVADAAYNPNRPGTTKATVAVISRSDSFADALPGNALAAEKHGPLMLTGPTKLDPGVAGELRNVLAPGATVYVLGGVNALSAQVEADIRAQGLNPVRLSGPDRYSTATRIAAEVSPNPHTVLVATGANFPDALAAGAAAATDPNGGVVLLTNDKTMPAATQAYLNSVDTSKTTVYGVGGQAVTALNATPLAGRFTPLQGADRFATDRAVANNTTLFPAPTAAGIATGANWPDALSGGAYIGALHGPLLLVDNNSSGPGTPIDQASRWLSGHQSTLTQLAVFGGPSAIRDGLVQSFGDFAFGAGNWDPR